MAAPSSDSSPSRLRPKSYTVFAAAFLAGAAAAVGVNRVLDVHLAQRRPQVECEPIFVALRPLPQGSPVTVWDVALKDWPKAMLPSTALRAGDSFEGFVLRHAIREGQPLLAVQLIRSESGADEASGGETFVPAVPASATTSPTAATTTGDLWTPAAMDTQSAAPVADLAAGADHVTADGPQEPTAETVTPDPLPVDQPSPPQPTAVIADAESEPAESEPAESEPAESEAAESEAAKSAPAESEPAEQAPMVAAVEPTSPTADPPVAPSPATTVVTTPSQPTPADEITSAEMSEAVATDGATDVATMPSVIKQPAVAATTPSQPPAGDAGRYLVVPERIALQADTSFTTPRPQPPGPPATARPSAATKPRAPTRTSGQTEPRRGAQAAPQPRQQSGPAPRSRPQPPPSKDPSTSSTRRGWMPPALAAGIEAISSPWQAAGSTSGRPQGGSPARR
ncbi:MAG: hypothetical protein FJ286_03975 [Planctomycetes bacterium]|nr:hypothetical protein [Planctomycetota bacterium]